ncbi:MAG TPA: hypothetical protein VHL31_00215 [Geminicoccus sp.]|jgi:hypothetical protein|uniref:hypothetical protein n=1 Tax=Geminicoccus sp. TaxID=2024832 RepID=UPI002E35A393|nr:hypothetical protein [Geminicoccus sp.]HEX2524716.1 hypothetical protein [Geminicoccus sp.]
MIESRPNGWNGFLPRLVSLVVGAMLLAGCAGMNDLGPYPDLRWKIESYYRDNAWEEGARCVLPTMSVTRWRVVEETPEKIVMEVRYAWQDDRNVDYNRFPGLGGSSTCVGFNERLFTIAKGPNGLQVQSMTGEQRR